VNGKTGRRTSAGRKRDERTVAVKIIPLTQG